MKATASASEREPPHRASFAPLVSDRICHRHGWRYAGRGAGAAVSLEQIRVTSPGPSSSCFSSSAATSRKNWFRSLGRIGRAASITICNLVSESDRGMGEAPNLTMSTKEHHFSASKRWHRFVTTFFHLGWGFASASAGSHAETGLGCQERHRNAPCADAAVQPRDSRVVRASQRERQPCCRRCRAQAAMAEGSRRRVPAFRHVCRMGLEGIVSKRIDAPYRSGPSKTWLKSKNPANEATRREDPAERWMLPVLHLDPTITPAAAIGAFAMLGYDPPAPSDSLPK